MNYFRISGDSTIFETERTVKKGMYLNVRENKGGTRTYSFDNMLWNNKEHISMKSVKINQVLARKPSKNTIKVK